VKLSFYHARDPAEPFQIVPLVKDHGHCDELLVKSGINYTILAASHLMSNPFVLQGQKLRSAEKPAVLVGASANKGVNYVSPNDIADAATRVILNPLEHGFKAYTLTGSSPIKEQEVCKLLGSYLEKPIMYAVQPINTFRETEMKSNDPEWMVDDFVTLEMIKASGYEEKPDFATHDIETICGHPPENFAAYLESTQFMSKIEQAY